METPLVDKDYLLQKIEGKGGWTYAEIPEIPMPKTPFGMFKVKGSIDNYEFTNVRLMPLGNGHLLLPVNAETRKEIKKQAGDTVHIILYEDSMPMQIPEELLICMEHEEGILAKFQKYSDSEKKVFIDWIYSAKTEQTKIERIAKMINKIEEGENYNITKLSFINLEPGFLTGVPHKSGEQFIYLFIRTRFQVSVNFSLKTGLSDISVRVYRKTLNKYKPKEYYL